MKNLKDRIAFGIKQTLTPTDAKTLARLDTPAKIQTFIDALPTNHEQDGETCLAVAGSLKLGAIHCIEGALIAACALWMMGTPPVLLNLKAEGDDDHAIAVFKHNGHWGAVSKSNHIWLRWRDPIYRTHRELAMSYFHEYVNGNKKTLRAYSKPFDLRRYQSAEWIGNTGSCWELGWALDESRHYPLITPQQAKALRKRDSFEQQAGKLVEFPSA